MLVGRKLQDKSGNNTRYSLVLFNFFSIAISYHILRGDHLELTIGIGPLDFNFGTTIWRRFWRE